MDTSRSVVGALLTGLAACSHEEPPAIPSERPVLRYGSAAQDQNRRDLPPGFGAPDGYACASDITRIYPGELFLQRNVQVNWHWTRVVRWPNPVQPTLDHPFPFYGHVRVGWT